MDPITIIYPVRPKQRSLAAGRIVDLFGLAAAESPHVVARNFEVEIPQGSLVLIHGPSGTGKSSLLRALGRQFHSIDAMALDLPEVALIDALPGAFEDRVALLAACGLSEARLLLRTPRELSDGQRYRFRIALAISQRAADSRPPHAVLLDEFTASLDRTLAKVIAYNLRRLTTQHNITVLCATTHTDILDDLNADLLIECRGNAEIIVVYRTVKKKSSASPVVSGSATAPRPIGRTSLGGIIAATILPSLAKSSCSGTVSSPSASASSPPPPRA